MAIKNKKILITGGAGFIGSHLVDFFAKNNEIVIFDNLSSEKIEKIVQHLENPNVKFVQGDLKKKEDLEKIADDYDIVFHLAANPNVNVQNFNTHFMENVYSTYNLVEMLTKTNSEKLVFTSSSTVYGEAKEIPTPENYSPLLPISYYGSTKLLCENLLLTLPEYHDFKIIILRLANVVGRRMKRGVIKDFILKLKTNPKKLDILGNGTQEKSYVYIEDCLNGILTATEKSKNNFSIFNVGSEDRIKVKDIAKIVIEEMGIKNTKLNFIDTLKNGRGWKGDVKLMHLSISKLKSLGWKPRLNSEEAVRKAVNDLKEELI